MSTPFFQIIDDSSPSPLFTTTGTGFAPNNTDPNFDAQGNFRNNQHFCDKATSNDGSSVAIYTFTLPAGIYDVWSTWNAWGSNTSTNLGFPDVSYKVFDNTTLLSTLTVDQSDYPIEDGNHTATIDLTANDVGWRHHGSFTVSSTTLKIQIIAHTASGSSGYFFADAFRVVASSYPTNPTFTYDFTDGLVPTDFDLHLGTWAVNSGVLQQTDAVLTSEKRLRIWPTETWDNDHIEITCKMRIDAWVNNNGDSQAGLGLNYNSTTNGYELLFLNLAHNVANNSAVNDDFGGVVHFTFAWTQGSWYWFKFRRQSGTIFGKIWADGTGEPGTWQVTQLLGANSFSTRSGGYPGLIAGGNASLVSFDSITVGPIPGSGTGSGSVSPTHPTLTGTGTWTGPVFTGSGSLSKSHSTVAGTATFHLIFTGSGTPARSHATPAGTATYRRPTGSGTPARTHATVAGTATFISPRTGSGSVTPSHSTVAGTATRVVPVYHGSVPSSRTWPWVYPLYKPKHLVPLVGGLISVHTLSGTGTAIGVAGRTGSGSPARSHATVAGTGTFVTHNTGSGTPARTHSTVAGTATRVVPVFHGSSSLSSVHTLVGVGSFLAGPGTYTGSGSTARSHATLAGTAGILPIATSSCGLFMRGTTNPEWLNNMTLAIQGVGFSSGTTNLSVKAWNVLNNPAQSITLMTPGGLSSNNQSTLFTRGYSPTTGSMPMVVPYDGSPVARSSTQLYIASWFPINRSTTLFLSSPIPTTTHLNMFVAAPNPTTLSGSSPFYLEADTFAKGTISLFIDSNNHVILPLNLTIRGIDSGNIGELMNLAVRGGGTSIGMGVPLALKGVPPFGDFSPFYVCGAGVNPGFTPSATPMNLYVQRGNEGGIYLFLNNLGVESFAPLSITGVPGSNDILGLFIAGDGGTITGNANLVIPSASDFTTAFGSFNLVLPKVVGAPNGTTKLFISGWSR